MKKVLLALLLILAMILTSCDAFIDTKSIEKPEIFFIGIGLDYKTWNRTGNNTRGNSYLKNTRNDLEAITSQFEYLAQEAGYEYRFVTYDDFTSDDITFLEDLDGSRTPVFNYNFMFNSWSSKNPEVRTEEYHYDNIANGQKNEDGSPKSVSLKEFAVNYTDALKSHLTDDGLDMPGKNDIIIFYYTGHGLENGLGPALYYQTGREAEDPRMRIRQTVEAPNENYIIPLPYLYLDKYLFDDFESTVVTLFDCCYSGYAIDNSDLGSIHNFKELIYNNGVRDDELQVPSIDSIFTNTYLATFTKTTGNQNRYHLTAAHSTQTSFDKDFDSSKPGQKQFGAFTYQVLDYLDYDFEGSKKSISLNKNLETNVGSVGNPSKKIYSVSDLYNHIFHNIGYETKTYATPNVTRSRYDLAFFMM